jgi:hypothetical protein
MASATANVGLGYSSAYSRCLTGGGCWMVEAITFVPHASQFSEVRMNKIGRKSKSTNAVTTMLTRAFIHYAADLGSRGILDLATLSTALRPRHRRHIRQRRPDKAYKPEDLLTPDQAATVLSQSPKTLANQRSKGNGPRFSKLSNRAVRYKYQHLMDFAESRSKMSTSEAPSDTELGAKGKLPKTLLAATPSHKGATHKTPDQKRRKRKKTTPRRQQVIFSRPSPWITMIHGEA